MKQLSLPKEKHTTELITNDSFIGVEWLTGTKGMVIRRDTESFIGIESYDLDGNGKWSRKSKREYAEYVIERQDGKVFIFESGKELLEWLIE